MISQKYENQKIKSNKSTQFIEISRTTNKKTEINSIIKKSNENTGENKFSIYKTHWLIELKKKKEEFEDNWENPPKIKASFDDFILLRTLGQGSFGRVVLSKHKKTIKPFALKIMPKKKILNSRQIEHTLNEKKILSALNFDYIVSLAYSFTDNANLFLALEFVSGGELFTHLRKSKFFTEARTKFYIAQIILGIEYLHSLDILHRDLKPENTLIGQDGYVKITDFGFAKIVKTRTFTFCGTPEYLAPEILAHQIYGKAVDWWTIGIFTYEMACGKPPFNPEKAKKKEKGKVYENAYVKMYEKIRMGDYQMSTNFSDTLKDFLKNMIQVDITKRYGNLKNGVDDIKKHAWFDNIDWWKLYNKKLIIPPHYLPQNNFVDLAANFDSCVENWELETNEDPLYEKEFREF